MKARVLALVLGVDPVVAAVEAAAVPEELVTDADVVVVVLLVGAGTNEMSTVACFPPASPKASWHEAPAASCAAVGGQGYLAASVAGLCPALSVAGQWTRSEPPQGGPVVPAMMVKLVERVPLEVVVMSPATEIPLHPTGTDWLIGAPKLTVGWPEALLHSRTAPAELESNPDPVRATLEPPFRHVPGFAVRLGPEPVDEVECALQGTVVVVVVVVGRPRRGRRACRGRGGGAGGRRCRGRPAPGRRGGGRRGLAAECDRLGLLAPPATPNAMTHESPAEICAAVGGQG